MDEPFIGAPGQGDESAISAPAPAEPASRRASWWLIAITVMVYLALIALETLNGTDTSIAIRFGGSVFFVLLVVGVAILFFSIWQRFRNSRSRYRIALVLGIWLLIGVVSNFLRMDADYASQRQVVATDMRAAVALAETRHKALRANQILPAYMPQLNATGFWGDAERVWMMALSQGVTLREQYETELAAQGFYKVLAPGWSTAGPNLAESKRILKQARSSATRYDALSEDMIDRVPTMLEALPFKTVTREQKEAMLRGAREKLPDSRANMHEIWKAESAIVDELAAMIDVLDHSRGRWREENGRLIFARKEDLAAYETHQRAASDQDARVAQLREAAFAPVFAMLGS